MRRNAVKEATEVWVGEWGGWENAESGEEIGCARMVLGWVELFKSHDGPGAGGV